MAKKPAVAAAAARRTASQTSNMTTETVVAIAADMVAEERKVEEQLLLCHATAVVTDPEPVCAAMMEFSAAWSKLHTMCDELEASPRDALVLYAADVKHWRATHPGVPLTYLPDDKKRYMPATLAYEATKRTMDKYWAALDAYFVDRHDHHFQVYDSIKLLANTIVRFRSWGTLYTVSNAEMWEKLGRWGTVLATAVQQGRATDTVVTPRLVSKHARVTTWMLVHHNGMQSACLRKLATTIAGWLGPRPVVPRDELSPSGRTLEQLYAAIDMFSLSPAKYE